MRTTKIVAALALAAACASASAGVPMTGNILIEGMRSPRDSVLNRDVYRYIQGSIDVLWLAQITCPPKGATPRQAMDMLQQYLEDVPKVRDTEGGILVFAFFKTKWPCEKPGTKPKS